MKPREEQLSLHDLNNREKKDQKRIRVGRAMRQCGFPGIPEGEERLGRKICQRNHGWSSPDSEKDTNLQTQDVLRFQSRMHPKKSKPRTHGELEKAEKQSWRQSDR